MKLFDNIIYCLYCPISQEPVYVGKTSKGLDRCWVHVKEKSHNDKVNKWVSYLRDQGREPVVVVLDNASHDDEILSAKEQFWIQRFIGQGCQLLNQEFVNEAYFISSSIQKAEDGLKYVRAFVIIKRKQAGLTQAELADKAGLSITFIRKLEQGKTNLHVGKIIHLLKMFGGTLNISAK